MFLRIAQKTAFLVLLCLITSTAKSETTLTASLDGVPGEVILNFDSHLDSIVQRIKVWEETLAGKGIEAEFLLGAGDLRRALFNMPVDGPGDFELFLNFRKIENMPYDVADAFDSLERLGVDIRGDLRKLFGPKKKIDLFIRSPETVAVDGNWTGEFGESVGLGDTSVNQLTYSLRKNELRGIKENLVNLSKGIVTYTAEEHRTTPWENPKEAKEIPKRRVGTGVFNKGNGLEKMKSVPVMMTYPRTIIRQFFRNIRLKVDLMVSDNPNNIKMDGSFDKALRGLELFFEGWTPEEIGHFVLRGKDNDDVYVNLFLKIFKRRSNEDRKQMREMLYREHEASMEILKAMGIDVDLLLAHRDQKAKDSVIEAQAIFGNARFNEVRPLVDHKKGDLKNPFNGNRITQTYLETVKLRKVPTENFKLIPLDILSKYSPKLAVMVKRYSDLSLEEKRETLKKYTEALKFLAQTATIRVKGADFLDTYVKNFDFIHGEHTENESMMDYLARELESFSTSPRSFAVATAAKFNTPVTRKINQLIDDAPNKTTPTIFVDLEGTLLDSASRYAAILKEYDRLNGTHFFDELHHSQVPEDHKEFLFALLSPKIKKFSELADRVENISDFINGRKNKLDFVALDVGNPHLVKKLMDWKAKGAEIVYLSSRWESAREVTEASLSALGLPTENLLMDVREVDLKEGDMKVFQMQEFLRKHDNHEAIAVIESDRSILNKAEAALPGIYGVQAIIRHDGAEEKGDVFLIQKENREKTPQIFQRGTGTCTGYAKI